MITIRIRLLAKYVSLAMVFSLCYPLVSRSFTSLSSCLRIQKMSSVPVPVIPVVTQITPYLARFLGCNPGKMTLQGTNTYLVGSGKKRILIDTGDADKPEYTAALDKYLASEQVEIDQILITHWHNDHIDGVKDVRLLKGARNATIWKYPRSDAKDDYAFPIEYLKDGQTFPVSGTDRDTLKIIHTPGHATDHVVLTLSTDDSLFSGDCILGEGTAVFEDLYDYMNSLEKILTLKPTVIYPGHGNIVNDPVEKIEFYIKHRMQREKQILDCLRSRPEQLFTEMDVVEVVYVDTPKELWPAAAINVHQHLVKLVKDKKVIQVTTDDGTMKWKIATGGAGVDDKVKANM